MDSKRLTEIEEPWRKAGALYLTPPALCPKCDSSEFISAGPQHYECLRCSLEREIEWLRESYKLLRADAAELARLAQAGYELSRYAAAIHWDGRRNEQDWLDGLRDDIEKLQKTAEPLLSRPSVVNLLKEKDQ